MPNTSWSGARSSFPPRVRRRILAQSTGCAIALPGICTDTPTEVDHIIGRADALASGWDPDDIDAESNAQGVCAACHKVKTADEQARGRARLAATRRATTSTAPTERHPGRL